MRLGKRRAVVVEAEAAFDREPTAGPAVLRKQAYFADAPCQLIGRREFGDLIGRTVVESVLDTGVVEAVVIRIGAVEKIAPALKACGQLVMYDSEPRVTPYWMLCCSP